jgi:hypothetical protein
VIVQGLGEQLGLPCQKWDPTAAAMPALPPAKAETLAKDALYLADALGAAAAWCRPDLLRLDLLAEAAERERRRRRNPVRRAALAAGVVLLCLLAWAGQLALENWTANSELVRSAAESERLLELTTGINADLKKAGDVGQVVRSLEGMSTNRFLWVAPLNALQFAMTDGVQVTRLQVLQEVVASPGAASYTKPDGTQVPAVPPGNHERVTMIIRARNTGPPSGIDRFIERIAAQPYFASHLRAQSPVLLKERNPPQVDPLNPANTFVLFTLECVFAERPL